MFFMLGWCILIKKPHVHQSEVLWQMLLGVLYQRYDIVVKPFVAFPAEKLFSVKVRSPLHYIRLYAVFLMFKH